MIDVLQWRKIGKANGGGRGDEQVDVDLWQRQTTKQ